MSLFHLVSLSWDTNHRSSTSHPRLVLRERQLWRWHWWLLTEANWHVQGILHGQKGSTSGTGHSGHSGRFWCQIIHTIHGTNGIFTYMNGWLLMVNVWFIYHTWMLWVMNIPNALSCNINVWGILNGAWFVHEPRWHTPTSFGKLQLTWVAYGLNHVSP